MKIRIRTSDGSYTNADWDTDLTRNEALTKMGDMLATGGSMVFGNCVISGHHVILIDVIDVA
jgi:hypothetical protein